MKKTDILCIEKKYTSTVQVLVRCMYQVGAHCTEVGRAFLNNFQKIFLYKVFINMKIARKFKFHMWMIISGSKSVKRSQKILKKATKLDLYLVFPKKNLPWLIWYISMAIIRGKKVWCHYIVLGLIFSHLGKFKHHFQIY